METKPLTNEEILILKVGELMLELSQVSRSVTKLIQHSRPVSKSSAQSFVLTSDLDELFSNMRRADEVKWPKL